jgi:hypothetical protein
MGNGPMQHDANFPFTPNLFTPFMGEILSTHDFQLQIPKVDASCLHKSLGVTSRLLSYLRYDEQLLRQGLDQR